MRASLAGIVVSTAGMAGFHGLAAWIGLRFAAGVFSAWALVATSAWALQYLVRAGRAELSGMVYSGVGLGIVFVGLFCLAATRPDVPASRLWLELGVVAALAVAVPGLFVSRPLRATATSHLAPSADHTSGPHTGLVICYGVLGFGYILPATFLPALAREVVDDPQLFGLAWPAFGLAAALSTIATSQRFGRASRLRVWAVTMSSWPLGWSCPAYGSARWRSRLRRCWWGAPSWLRQ
jgi:Uncharacterised MFS-type transporter YbfB